MKGKRDPRFQQVYSPPFIFVRKSFQDANNDIDIKAWGEY